MPGTVLHAEEKAAFKELKIPAFVEITFYWKGYVFNKIIKQNCFVYWLKTHVQEKHREREH